jgi:hypothetical protein
LVGLPGRVFLVNLTCRPFASKLGQSLDVGPA